MIESECIDEELKNNNFNEDDTFDMIDVTVTPSSKFILSLTDPDFTAYKVRIKWENIHIVIFHNFFSMKIRLMIHSKSLDRWPFSQRNDIGRCHEVFA